MWTAIKTIRELTIMYENADSRIRHQLLDAIHTLADLLTPLSEEDDRIVRAYTSQPGEPKSRIPSIKVCRELYGMELIAAKKYTEDLLRKQGLRE